MLIRLHYHKNMCLSYVSLFQYTIMTLSFCTNEAVQAVQTVKDQTALRSGSSLFAIMSASLDVKVKRSIYKVFKSLQ